MHTVKYCEKLDSQEGDKTINNLARTRNKSGNNVEKYQLLGEKRKLNSK